MFDNYKTLTDQQINDPHILETSTRRVTVPAFVSGEKKTLGVLLTGIDVAEELRLTKLKDALATGSFLAPNGEREIIMGKRLAEKLGVNLGDEVAIIGQALDGSRSF